MRKSFFIFLLCALASPLFGQTNFATLSSDGVWTWFNDPRALYHNGALYFGYVRADGKVALNSFNVTNGSSQLLWTSTWSEKDDHDNPGLLRLEDGRLLAIYAHHGSAAYFSYRTSLNTNPVAAADWGAEQTFTSSGGVTYSNPYQLSSETGRVYNFMRNLNFNPTVTTSTNSGTNWSTPQILIKTGTGGIRPYVKYSSDYSNRVDFLYTDGHPRNLTNSLYNAFYSGGAIYKTDGTFLKNFADIPLLHDSGERGSVIYQYSDAPSADPNVHIATGRAWCWELVYQSNGAPACVFSVQVDNVTGTNWFDDRIYYYYARWTGTNWQKRFIAQAGRPIYTPEDDYAGGLCIDPKNPNVIYISSNAANPFDLSNLTNVALRANERYELYRGVTTNGGLTFSWSTVTTNSAQDNLRPYIPRNSPSPTVIWFAGNYTTYSSYNTAVVGLFSAPLPTPPTVQIINPKSSAIALTNINNKLVLSAAVSDDGLPAPLTMQWTTANGPTNAIFSNPNSSNTTASFPLEGTYLLQLAASDSLTIATSQVFVAVGASVTDASDSTRVLWLKLDETSGTTASDNSGNNNFATLTGNAIWRPTGGIRGGTLQFDGTNSVATVADADALDGTTAFSLTYWFRAEAYPADSAGLVSKRDGPSLNNAFTTYLKVDKHIYVDVEGGSNNRFPSTTLFNTGQWYHVALTFDGTLPAAQRVSLWVNGALDVVANESSSSISNYPSNFRIGNTHSGAVNWFNGLIDDVRFYRRALTSSEIQSLARTNFAPSVFVGVAPSATSHVEAFLNGSVTDDGQGGSLTSSWSKFSGPAKVAFNNSTNPVTGVTFDKAGSYVLRLSASDSQATVCDDLVVSVATNLNFYDDWVAQFFPGNEDANVIGITADPDLDGLKNLMEFALGTSPSIVTTNHFAPGQPGLPIGSILAVNGTNYLTLRVQRPLNRGGITYLSEASGNLTNWVNGLPVGLPSPSGPGTEVITFRDVLPTHQNPMRFMRLKITQP
ncbi:MAG: LamG-like jellyroll fold domain-containing protein [Verrucomicrobiota bacterium]